jgi:hypothetical protein
MYALMPSLFYNLLLTFLQFNLISFKVGTINIQSSVFHSIYLSLYLSTMRLLSSKRNHEVALMTM